MKYNICLLKKKNHNGNTNTNNEILKYFIIQQKIASTYLCMYWLQMVGLVGGV